MVSYLITGANRGIGLEMVTQLAARPDSYILAGSRNPSSSADSALDVLAEKYAPRIKIVKLDATSDADVEGVVQTVNSWEHTNGRLNVLINNAGSFAGGWSRAQATALADYSTNLDVNLLGPIRLTLALLPALRLGGSPIPSQIYVVSSRMGAFGWTLDTGNADSSSYCVSKAAVNMWLVMLDAELRIAGEKIVIKAIHPGYVRTDFTGSGEIDPPEAVEGCLKVIDSAEEGDKCCLMSYTGERMAW